MTGRGGMLLAALLGAACSSSPGAPDAGGTSTTGGSGGTTGGTCHPPGETACTSQVDCAPSREYGGLVESACVPDGGATVCAYQPELGAAPSCAPDEPNVICEVTVSPSITTPVGSFFLRAYYPEGVSGAATSCAAITAEATPQPDGGEAEDSDAKLNLSYWGGFQVSSTAAQSSTIDITAALVAGSGQTLYLEAYSGGLDSSTGASLGTRLGTACLDAQAISAASSGEQTLLFSVQ